MTRVGSRIVVLAAGGLVGATLVATPALATTVDSPEGGATATTSATYAESTLVPGQRPGAFYGAPDRTRGNVYGAWTDDAEARARWVLESPRGPWDTVRIVDRLGPGQQFDCEAGVRVRATAEVDPETGYLVDPVELAADRVEIACSGATLSVTVAPVGDEIVEVSVVSSVDEPPTVANNLAEFVATRAEPGSDPTPPAGDPTLPAVDPTPPVVVDPSVPEGVESGKPEGSPVPAPEPTVQELPAAALPARLAETGADGIWLPLLFAGALGATGAATSLRRRRRHRSRS